ncbi:MAG: hypothetical protein HY303_14735 [Candidatus Wallbacteria bacterium]|nr:hypothetical protein [Candidatus Wallbacteria bacterium]
MKSEAIAPQYRKAPSPQRPELPATLPRQVELLALRCPASGRLLSKARVGEPLTTAEAHILIQVFGPLGEEGRLFVHQVLAGSPSYDPDAVNRQLRALPPQPIGCRRVRGMLRKDGAPDLCGCVFRLPPQTYEAPVVHLDWFPPAPGKLREQRNPPPDLDGDGRAHGYLSRLAKAASRLFQLRPPGEREED